MDPDTLLLIVLLVRHSTTRIIVLIVYVDDINIISSDSIGIADLKKLFGQTVSYQGHCCSPSFSQD